MPELNNFMAIIYLSVTWEVLDGNGKLNRRFYLYQELYLSKASS